jgi:predicted metalloprotease with PDZ domain
MSAKLFGIRAVQAMLLFPMLSAGTAAGADLLRYTVRAEPFEVELTLPNGEKQRRALPRQPTHFVHRANIRWPVPAGHGDTRIRCEINWVGFPASFRLVNSYGIDQRVQKFETNLDRLRKAVFAGGELRTARSKRGLILVTHQKWKFSDETALTMFDRLDSVFTELWRDRGLRDHRVFMVPASGLAGDGGEGRANGLLLELPPELENLAQVARLLAHEMFHEWNPTRIHRSDDETLYWFTEGFTEYYAVAALWRSGIWNFQQVLDNFNFTARSYFASPVRNLTDRRMVELRQSNRDANALPYLQGYLLAWHWNKDGKTLDRAMRYLLKHNRHQLSNTRIIEALRSSGVEDPEADIQRFILKGNTIEFRPDLWNGCATETKLQVAEFDLGFDTTASLKTSIIQGVKPDSNAFRAGVRNGQKWEPSDVVFGDPSYQVDIALDDEQGRRHVKYYPTAGVTIALPQYKIQASSCDPWTLRPVSRAR